MSWRIATSHQSAYHYNEPVVASHNEARITPIAFDRQGVIESSVRVEPAAPLYTYLDYWSTTVVAFNVEQSHSDLVVTGNSVVETSASLPYTSDLGWAELSEKTVSDRLAEFLVTTAYTESDETLRAVATELAASGSPIEAYRAITAWVHGEMAYQAGTTRVSTSALGAWKQRSGVCQDFAHLSLSLLRSLGIPSRYVSGYLHPRPEAAIGEKVAGASHAWVEAWLGTWLPADPTNGEPVGERHVTVTRGRDYRDVAPLRGVYHGGKLDRLEVTVELTRLA